MQNALIYSAGFEGHRQVYVFVLAHILNENGFNIFIAGNTTFKAIDESYITRIKKNKQIVFIDTSHYANCGLEITLDEFIDIQTKFKIDLTIFADADHHISLFTSQILNKRYKLLGRTIGIFLRPFYYYEKMDFIDKLRYIKRLKDNWKNNARLFHDFSLDLFKLLDKACYIDEKFVSCHKKSVWLPDVFQQYAEELINIENREEQIWIEKLELFKAQNKNRFMILYFGTAQMRRGYDILLKLAVDNNACFIHCGLNNEKQNFEFDINKSKETLLKKGRIFETNQYISDPKCIEYFFKSVSHLVLPYRKFMGSSGVMLQALSYGIPVLVPEMGIIGHRVNTYNLGMTFENEYSSLLKQFKQFIETPVESYQHSISKYMEYQSVDQLKNALSGVINDKKYLIKLPV